MSRLRPLDQPSVSLAVAAAACACLILAGLFYPQTSTVTAGGSASGTGGSVHRTVGVTRSVTAGLSGDQTGITLIERVSAAYGSVPGVTSATTSPRGKTLNVTELLQAGVVEALSATEVSGTAVIGTTVEGAAGIAARAAGAACWRAVGGPSQAAKQIGAPFPQIQAPATVSAPRRVGGTWHLSVQSGSRSSTTYEIDATTLQLIKATSRVAGIHADTRYVALSTAPALPAPQPLCGG